MTTDNSTLNNNSSAQRSSRMKGLSTLHSVISYAHLLHQTGYDEKKHTATYVGSADELSYIEGAADASITSIALGISAIGKLMAGMSENKGFFDEDDFNAMGWLLNDLGASVVALQNIQIVAGDAVTAASKIK